MFNVLRKKTLYYPGCLNKSILKNISENYARILKKIGINFIVLDEELCCGAPALDAGYKKDFEDLREKNLEIFKKNNIGKIITPCPHCLKVFSEKYGLKTEHITKTLTKRLNKLPLKFDEEITYHDPCNLGRLSNIYGAPRKILSALGFHLKEFEKNKENSVCCGAGGGLKRNLPTLANKIAKKRLKECKTKKLVTSCPLCYAHLKENTKKIDILELSEVV